MRGAAVIQRFAHLKWDGEINNKKRDTVGPKFVDGSQEKCKKKNNNNNKSFSHLLFHLGSLYT